MEFRLLGPVQAIHEGRPLPLGGRKKRALIACLLLEANKVVSKDRLIDMLWGEDPPASAGHAVEVYVSALRKSLGTRLETRPPGYLIEVAQGELDLERFERLAAAGRDALSRDDAAEAARQLHNALELWMGPPLADFSEEWFASSEIARLEEARASTLEDRIEADLALGRHAELVGELSVLIAAEPFRERARELLMIALYRSGRQAEALEAYQDARRVMLDELGLEPTGRLRATEAAILRQDPELDPPAGRTRSGAMTAFPTFAERKLVTVLACGIDDAPDPHAGEEDPERFRHLLDEMMSALAPEVEAAGGAVVGPTSHGFLAVFGAPRAVEDHAERACYAALAMQRRARELEWVLAVKFGLASGEVIVDVGGSGEIGPSGQAVTLAARLGMLAEPGDVLVGERTASSARAGYRFAFHEREGGRPGAAGYRRLLEALPKRGPRVLPGLSRTFVGRATELEALERALRRTRDTGTPRLVCVVGEPGVGKTSLVGEFVRRLAAGDPTPIVHVGRCLAYGKGITYWPLGEILREHLDLRPDDPPAATLRRLEGREILGLTLGLDVAGNIHPQAARDRLRDAWVALAGEMAESSAVLVVEDVHWAEPPLLEILEDLVRMTDGTLLVVTTTRPELFVEIPGWGRGRRSTVLDLPSLSNEETSTMIRGVLAGEPEAAVEELVVGRAEGNPFFVEELLGTLIEQGALRATAGGWALGAAVRTPLPDSIRGLLSWRLDLLPPEEKTALQSAAVIGRVFETSELERLLGERSPDYDLLRQRGFVLEDVSAAGDGAMTFKHALTREVAYSTLPLGLRARLHAAYADQLETRGREVDAPLIAHHYSEALPSPEPDLVWSDPEELGRLRALAVRWLRRAAGLAASRYSVEEAVAMYRRALDLERDPESRAEIWQAIGGAHALRYEGNAMSEALHEAIALTGRAELKAQAYSDLAFETAARWGMLNPMPAREVVDGWIERSLELSGPTSPARAKALVAKALWYPDRSDEAAAEAVAIADQLPDAELRSHAWNARACAAFVAGRYDESRGWAERRLPLLERISDPDHVVDIYGGMIPGCIGAGRIEDARRYAALHDEVARTLSPHHQMHAVAMRLEVEELVGTWETILGLEEHTREAVDANRETACVRNPRSLLVCALANERTGDHERAAELVEAAEAVGKEGFERSLAAVWTQLALAREDREEMARLLPILLPPPPAKNWWQLATVAARLDALVALGHRDSVEEEAGPARANGGYLEPFALRALGQARGDVSLLEEASSRFRAMGLAWHAEQTDRLASVRG